MQFPLEVPASSADVQAEIKSWADWLVRVEAHPVGAIALAVVGVFAIAELLAWWFTKLIARRGGAAEERRIRDKIGPLFNILFGLLAVGATGMGGSRVGQVWMGAVIAALSFALHFAWVKREATARVIVWALPIPAWLKARIIKKA